MQIKSSIKDLLLYLVVGVAATLTEWGIFYIGSKFLILLHYTLLTVIAYIISTFVNWALGRLLVFKDCRKSLFREIAEIYASSVLGLVLNLLIMFVLIDMLSIGEMFSKIIATGLVFVFNFLIRKLYIYKR